METLAAETKKTKDRSPGFPFISLARSLERARQFYVEEKRGAAPYTRAVMHWKYSEASSGGLQTVAALKQYGLLEDVGGSGKARQLKLTELALRILLDQRPDSEEREHFIKQAALLPAVASAVFERWPEGLPSDTTLNHFLVLELKFNEPSALSAIRILKENQLLANISAKDMESPPADSNCEREIEVRKVNAPAVRQEVERQQRASGMDPQQRVSVLAGAQRVLAHMGVGITMQFTDEPTKEVFEYLARYCTFEKDNVPSKMDVQVPASERTRVHLNHEADPDQLA